MASAGTEGKAFVPRESSGHRRQTQLGRPGCPDRSPVAEGLQKLTFTDALSFALMRRLRIEQVFTFDHHFIVAGFHRWPSA